MLARPVVSHRALRCVSCVRDELYVASIQHPITTSRGSSVPLLRYRARDRARQRSGGGFRDEMTISRRPNRRASMEYAPGPSNEIAEAITASNHASQAPQHMSRNSSFPWNSAAAMNSIATTVPTAGVRRPNTSERPLAMANKAPTHAASRGPGVEARESTPMNAAANPIPIRKSRRPAPGRPAGNDEKSRCSVPPRSARTEHAPGRIWSRGGRAITRRREFRLPLSR